MEVVVAPLEGLRLTEVGLVVLSIAPQLLEQFILVVAVVVDAELVVVKMVVLVLSSSDTNFNKE
jgi:hypothetical protein